MNREKIKEFIESLYKIEMEQISWGVFRNFNRFGLNAEIFEDEEDETHSINIRKIESVIDNVCFNPDFEVSDEFEINVMRANKFASTEYLTDEDVDTIFQLALFQEIKYS